MPIKETATHMDVLLAMEADISTDTTTTGAIIDTANYDGGLFFAFCATAYTDGTYTLKIEEGDAANLSDAAVVDSSKLVYGTLPAKSAITADGAKMSKEGVHSTKRYVRASIVSTSTSTGATIAMVAIGMPEVLPADQTA